MAFNGNLPSADIEVRYWLPTMLFADIMALDSTSDMDPETVILAHDISAAVSVQLIADDPQLTGTDAAANITQGAWVRVQFARGALAKVVDWDRTGDTALRVAAAVSAMWTKFNQEYGI
jgi:hypothetical protein